MLCSQNPTNLSRSGPPSHVSKSPGCRLSKIPLYLQHPPFSCCPTRIHSICSSLFSCTPPNHQACICFLYYTHGHLPIMFAYSSVGPPPLSVLMSGISVCLVHHVPLVPSTVLVGTWQALDQSLLSEWMHRQVDINYILFSG